MVGQSLQAYHESKTGLHYFVGTILHKCSRGFVMVLAICCSRSKQNIEVQLESKASLHDRFTLWSMLHGSKKIALSSELFQNLC
jgi:hypothetical protein